MSDMVKVFIGYDERQPVAFHTLVQSIIANSSLPVQVTPLVLHTLPAQRSGLTPFTFSRFLVPFLCEFQGWGIFLDIDIMVRGDIAELWNLRDDKYDVMVSKGEMRFEWASVMMFNNARCTQLTPDFVNAADGMHAISWTLPERVGDLPREWNHLVGYDAPKDAKLVHYTQGIPAFPETAESEYAKEWTGYAQRAHSSVPWANLMGNSVHAKPVYERLMKAGHMQGKATQT